MDILDINKLDYYSINNEYRNGKLTLDYLEKHKNSLGKYKKLLIYKPLGTTPKELADKVKELIGSKKAGFSSRLDPLAHGNMIVLPDEKGNQSLEYDLMNKIYHFQVIIGISTDTADINGLITNIGNSNITIEDLNLALSIISTRNTQVRPMHSSTTILFEGKMRPLWYVFNKIGKIDNPPIKECNLLEYKVDSLEDIEDNSKLVDEIIRRIELINKCHKFRQEETIPRWLEIPNITLKLAHITVKATSGFYIRQLVNDLVSLTNINMTIFEIYRNYLGE